MLLINMASAIVPFFLKMFFRSKEDRNKALIRFQEFIQKRKEYTLIARDSSDEFILQRAETKRKMAEAKRKMAGAKKTMAEKKGK